MPSQARQRRYWKYGVGRPLTAALPMGVDERAQWSEGGSLGSDCGSDTASPQGAHPGCRNLGRKATSGFFPNPLLTPPPIKGFASYDWLPAVLESILIRDLPRSLAPVMGSRYVIPSSSELFNRDLQDQQPADYSRVNRNHQA
jgi:hypothetical protein